MLQLGEQYNFQYTTKCDVEVILHLYAQGGSDNIARSLDGVFAFCLLDIKQKKIIIGRDPYGVRPLFKLYSNSGHLAISSESKVILKLTFLNIHILINFIIHNAHTYICHIYAGSH